MKTIHTLIQLLAALVILGTSINPVRADANDIQSRTAEVDQIFAGLAGNDRPGCAVAVSQQGHIALNRAYGMANLEFSIPNSVDTVFEPGSVSKQFTAAAAIMLALDGLISLDDDIRQYFPEMPDYGEQITIRQLIHHTSGLRDWGSIAGIEGWQRTTRVHTHKHVLDIAARQESLNYPPGKFYSYTNTGYNLLAMLVERVTGKTLDEFSRERIFGPLGMTSTQWRDDFTEVVRNRSVGYVPNEDGGWNMLMPFENVHGNGGLLTTVGDLLKFTHNLETGEVGGAGFIEEMHRQGRLDDGQQIEYAGGVFVGDYKGIAEIEHAGSTAAYKGYLTRFPDYGIAVSLMCNAGDAAAGQLAHAVADIYLAGAVTNPPPIAFAPGVLQRYVGRYRNPNWKSVVEFSIDDGNLLVGGPGPDEPVPLTPLSTTRFEGPGGLIIEFEADGNNLPIPVLETPVSSPVRLEPIESYTPSMAELDGYQGEYSSHEAEVAYSVVSEDGNLGLVDRYGDSQPLLPAYRDGFKAPWGMVLFRRDSSGAVIGLSFSTPRVWDLRFTRSL